MLISLSWLVTLHYPLKFIHTPNIGVEETQLPPHNQLRFQQLYHARLEVQYAFV